MDNFGLVLILVLIALIFISAFFSGSETSITAINQIKLESAAESGQKSAKRVNSLRNKMNEVLGVILIGNNLVNISASALLTYFVIKEFGDEYVWAATLVLTILVIIFAEIAPKNFAAKKPEAIAYPASIILEFLTNYFGWLSRILNFFSSWITGVKGGENYFAQNLNRQELKSVLDKETEQVDKEEMEAMKSLLDLKELSVQDILIPMNQVIKLNLNDIDSFDNEERNRFYPVYEEKESEIIGFIHAKEIEELENFRNDLTDFLLEPYYVPESTQLFAQLKNFQKNGSEVALVVDEYGEVTGLITLEDLIELIVGQFNTVESEEDYEVVDEFTVIADGSTIIRELNKKLEWDLPEEGAKTLNGLVIDHLNQIPTNNVCIELKDYKLETNKIESNKVKEVKVSKKTD
ncbi:CNNM domain-containing protein [Gammaproteobacteria bacterium]|nr:CNNM domain-containing protein [Gammaproteobacteria bacterium]